MQIAEEFFSFFFYFYVRYSTLLQIPVCRRMLGSNPGLLWLWHLQLDALSAWLDLNHLISQQGNLGRGVGGAIYQTRKLGRLCLFLFYDVPLGNRTVIMREWGWCRLRNPPPPQRGGKTRNHPILRAITAMSNVMMKQKALVADKWYSRMYSNIGPVVYGMDDTVEKVFV